MSAICIEESDHEEITALRDLYSLDDYNNEEEFDEDGLTLDDRVRWAYNNDESLSYEDEIKYREVYGKPFKYFINEQEENYMCYLPIGERYWK